MIQHRNYYYEVVATDRGIVTKFHSDVAPPRVGELIDISKISKLKGLHKVLRISTTFVDGEGEDKNNKTGIVEILIEGAESEKAQG